MDQVFVLKMQMTVVILGRFHMKNCQIVKFGNILLICLKLNINQACDTMLQKYRNLPGHSLKTAFYGTTLLPQASYKLFPFQITVNKSFICGYCQLLFLVPDSTITSPRHFKAFKKKREKVCLKCLKKNLLMYYQFSLICCRCLFIESALLIFPKKAINYLSTITCS